MQTVRLQICLWFCLTKLAKNPGKDKNAARFSAPKVGLDGFYRFRQLMGERHTVFDG